MTATPEASPVAAPVAADRAPVDFHRTARVTIPRVLRSEWTKLTSLRSTVWTLLAAFVVTVGLGDLICWAVVAHWDKASVQDKLTFQPVLQSLTGAYFSQIAIGVLGVLLITGEYSTGMIRTSLGSVPRRLRVLFAKAAVFAVTSFVVAFVAVLVAFFTGQAIFAHKHIGVGLGYPSAVRVLFGAAFFVTAIGLLGLALGTLLRSTGGSIASLLGLIFVVPIITNFLPGHWSRIHEYIPDGAGQALVTSTRAPGDDVLPPLAGLIVLLIWLAVGLGAAAYTLVRRDA
ncbi:ABC transporter permease subunit [Frankia sp. AgB1.9]|uniref:ABC transporter permease n=1 Tax=unclassified Frankia TaxID=2632575 RepID=UPI001931D483|nr:MULTISPECIES: ABC transporter permease [unclassified Frankia]MBL7492262.1 ABC transporter permease subunit [Frankia sp. AgW1.1]MBL7553452.1 ABC transporter permease subunit [Frankia sp. AgB1.9]MBL7619775.1 ABC transporter permease subunit [Frankia sp. AgB1.8]